LYNGLLDLNTSLFYPILCFTQHFLCFLVVLKYFLTIFHKFLILLQLILSFISEYWQFPIFIFRTFLIFNFELIWWWTSWLRSLLIRTFKLIISVFIVFVGWIYWVCILEKFWVEFCPIFHHVFSLERFIWLLTCRCSTCSSCRRLPTFLTYLCSTLYFRF